MTESRKQGQEPRPTERAEPILEHDTADLTHPCVDLSVNLGRYGAPVKEITIKPAVEARYGPEIPYSRLSQNLVRLVTDRFLAKRERDGRTKRCTLTGPKQRVLTARHGCLVLPEAQVYQ